MNSQKLKASVIICAYTMERFDDVREAVGSVMAQTLKPHEVIVAIDHNQELLEKLEAELPQGVKAVLNEGAHGLSETRNVGIRVSSGEIIAFIDDDVVTQENWLEQMVGPFTDASTMAVGGDSVPIWPGGKKPLWFPDEFDFIIGCTGHKKMVMNSNGEARNVTGSNMAFRAETFRRVGFWNTSLGAINGNSRGGEEADICMRIRESLPGSRIVFEPRAKVFHKISRRRATPGYNFDYCVREGLAKAKMAKTASSYTKTPLSTEGLFLRQILLRALPKRLKNIFRLSSLTQAVVIIINVSLVGTAYLLGRLVYGSKER